MEPTCLYTCDNWHWKKQQATAKNVKSSVYIIKYTEYIILIDHYIFSPKHCPNCWNAAKHAWGPGNSQDGTAGHPAHSRVSDTATVPVWLLVYHFFEQKRGSITICFLK
jgi:hypothetical protein